MNTTDEVISNQTCVGSSTGSSGCKWHHSLCSSTTTELLHTRLHTRQQHESAQPEHRCVPTAAHQQPSCDASPDITAARPIWLLPFGRQPEWFLRGGVHSVPDCLLLHNEAQLLPRPCTSPSQMVASQGWQIRGQCLPRPHRTQDTGHALPHHLTSRNQLPAAVTAWLQHANTAARLPSSGSKYPSRCTLPVTTG